MTLTNVRLVIALGTRERIRQAALDLFAVRGYDAVSIRDICSVVGIKESTVYFHYKNKQDIFDRLLADVRTHMEEMRKRFLERFSLAGHVTEEAFIHVALHYLHHFFLDVSIHKFIDMLSLERLKNENAAQLYHSLVFCMPIEHHALVFEQMNKMGVFAADDPLCLAREYQFAIYGAFMGGASDEELAAMIRRLYRRECTR